MRRLLYLFPVVVFVAVAVFFRQGLNHDPSQVPSPMIGKAAPTFALPPLRDGQPGFATADLMGHVTLVNFFASWCVPCRAEHALLSTLPQQAPGLTLVGIDYKNEPADALAWLARLGDPYARIAADRDGRVAIDWGVYGVPESYLIDKQGQIRFKQIGPFTPEDVQKKLLPLVAELSK